MNHDTGVKPDQTYDKANENISIATGNLNVTIPLISLPGRNGHNLNIALTYNSQQWTPVANYQQPGQNADNIYIGWRGEQAWQLSLPILSMSAITNTSGSTNQGTFTQSECWQDFAVVMGDGSRYAFPNAAADCWQTTTMGNGHNGPSYETNPFEQIENLLDADGVKGFSQQHALIDLTGFINNRIAVRLQDGSQIIFTPTVGTSIPGSGTVRLLASSLVDSNGNVTTITNTGNDLVITDSLHRSVTLSDLDSNYIPHTVQYLNSNGVQETITISGGQPAGAQTPTPTFAAPAISGAIAAGGTSGQTPAVSTLSLPNGLGYTFQYNEYGELLKITYPSGGYARYVYQAFPHALYAWTTSAGGYADKREVVGKYVCRAAIAPSNAPPSGYVGSAAPNTCPVAEDATTYTRTTTSNQVSSVTALDANSNQTVYRFDQAIPAITFGQTPAPNLINQGEDPTLLETSRTVYQGTSTPLVKIETSYVNSETGTTYDKSFSQTTTLYPSGVQSQVQWTRDLSVRSYSPTLLDRGIQTSGGYELITGDVLEERQYDFGTGSPGALIRRIGRTWLSTNPMNSVDYGSSSIYLLGRPTSETISDDVHGTVSQTTYEYDNYSTPIVASGSVQHGTAANGFGASYTTRGNLTSTKRLNSDGSSITESNTAYDDAGNVLSRKDARGYTTTYSYADKWANTACVPAGGSAAAYVSSVTNALSQAQTFTFNSCTGTVASTTDPNKQKTAFAYDVMDRRIQSSYPDTGSVCTQYSDAQNSTCPATSGDQLPIHITTTEALSASSAKTTSMDLDGLARSTTVTSFAGAVVQTVYDGVGNVASVTNPHLSNSSPDGVTAYSYDALGRKTLQCQPDNGTGPSSCSAGTSYQKWTYSGSDTTFTDEAGNSRRQTTDALGRITNVIENAYVPRNGFTCGGCTQSQIQTSYQYDALNLLNATQSGSSEVRVGLSGGTTTDVPRGRTFKYDSLSRLLVSTNPETGTICYGTVPAGQVPTVSNCTSGYDGNGNLQHKTDARGVTINYNYDALNRLISKTYSDGTPTASFGYDGKDETGADLPTPSLNSIGRLSRSVNATLGSNYSYDEMGRLKQQSYCFYGRCDQGFQVGAGYDLTGNMTSMTYPDGRTVEQDFDGAGRMSAVKYQSWKGTPHTASYLTAAAPGGYDPAGHLVSATLGSVAQMAAGYDSRQRVNYLAYGTPAQLLWGKQYGWTPNSNLQTMTDGFTGIQRQFGYDTLNRLTSAQDIVGATAPASDPIPFSTGTGSPTGTPTGNTSSSGAVPFWTDPNDSNVLTNPDSPGLANITNVGWQGGNGFNLYPGIQAPDGTLSATNFTSNLDSTDAFLIDTVADPHPYAATTMTASVWLRAPTGAQDIYLLFNDRGYGNWDTTAKLIHVTTEWQQFQVSKLTQGWLRDLQFMIGGGGMIGHGQTISIWNPIVEDSGTAGQTVTNLLPYSQRLGGSSWTIAQGVTTGVSAFDFSAVAPDGTMTASTVNADTDSYFKALVPTLIPLSGIPATGSVWLRSMGAPQNILLTLSEAGANGASSTLNTATVGLTSDWQRFQVSGLTQDTTRKLAFQIGGGNTFNTGQSIETWGAQVELAPSAGPYVATAGNAVSAGTNLTNILPFSQQPNGPSWGATVNFTGVVNAVTAPDGSQTGYEATAGGGTGGLVDDVAHPALYDGDMLTGSVFLRSPSGSGSVTVYLKSAVNTANPQNVPIQQATIQLTHTWQRVVLTGQAPNALSRLYLQIGDSSSTGQTIDVWGAQVELASTAGPYVATSALAVVAGQELTNLLPHGQQLSGPEWGVVGGNVTVNSAPGADGTMTAATITGTGSTTGVGTYVINEAPNPSYYDNQTMTASVFLVGPPGSSRNTYIYLVAQYDTGQNVVLASTNVSVTYAWQRVTVTGTTGNGLTKLYLQIGDPGSIFATGDKLYVWGPQLVVGSSAAPYTPLPTTTTSPVTGQPGNLVANGLNETYSYDSFGNILQKGSFNNVYTANNQLFGYPYDAAGNLLSIGSVYNQVSMTYDAENRISSANGVIYDYDAEGNRIQKEGAALTETAYFGGRPVARFDGSGGETDLIYGPTGLLAEVAGNENADPVFHLTDHLGTQVGSVNSSGILTNPLDYTPYGQIFSGSTNDPYFFTGKERDTESGLDYFGARYYGSSMGRFMSPDDPTGLYANQMNPQSWNLYSYVQNNPLSSVDPDGHDCIHINVDSGAYEGTDRGDCDNSTEEKANSGHYVDGTVGTINENRSGQVTGFSGTSYSGNLLTGAFASSLSYGPLEGPANQAGMAQIGSYATPVNILGGIELGVISSELIPLLGPVAPEIGLGVGGVGTVTKVGSRRNPVDVPRGTNPPTTINGRYYTGHAQDEMQASGIMPSMVEETIAHGTSSPGNTAGTTVHDLDGVRVVTNSQGGVVTTTPVGR